MVGFAWARSRQSITDRLSGSFDYGSLVVTNAISISGGQLRRKVLRVKLISDLLGGELPRASDSVEDTADAT